MKRVSASWGLGTMATKFSESGVQNLKNFYTMRREEYKYAPALRISLSPACLANLRRRGGKILEEQEWSWRSFTAFTFENKQKGMHACFQH